MALLSKKIFIDHSVFFAFIDRAHPKHTEAIAFFRYFAQESYRIFTDTQNIIKAYEKIYADISPSLAKDFLRTMWLSDINIIYPEQSDIKAALKALVNFRSTDLTFVQAQMAVLAVRRDIAQICTFDYLHPLFGLTVFYLPI